VWANGWTYFLDAARFSAFLPGARQRWAMAGRRLNRRAVTCSAATSNTMAVAGHPRSAPLMRTAVIIPTIEASPTITIITISVDEKVPDAIRAQPSRNNHITIISSSQKKRHGSAAHLLQPDWRAPRTMAIQSGAVCTMWRITSCDTAPTTSKAAIIVTQQTVKMRKSRSKSHLTAVVILTSRSAVSQHVASADSLIGK